MLQTTSSDDPKPGMNNVAVSVIVPCRNEADTIEGVLADLEHQSFAEPFEVIIADGFSSDGTREIVQKLIEGNTFRFSVRILDNTVRSIPAGLNVAVRDARGGFIVRIDCHSRLSPDYIEKIVEALQTNGQDVVGPHISFIPGSNGNVAYAIAALLNTRMGAGGTPSKRLLHEPLRVSHAPMSCYKRAVWERIGGYDEHLKTNEDFDFDYRASSNGASVFALPEPEFRSIARTSLSALCGQRWRYGWWKAAVLKKYPRSLHIRQMLPLAALFLAVLIPITLVVFPQVALPLALIALIYPTSSIVAAVVAVGKPTTKQEVRPLTLSKGIVTIVLAPVIYPIIHIIWATGVVAGLLFNRFTHKQAGA